MAVQLLVNRARAIGVAGTVAVHVVVIGVLMWLGFGPESVPPAPQFALTSVDITQPPPPPPPPAPPPPDKKEEGAAAPPSRGATKAPSPPPIPQPLPKPTPAQVAVDKGAGQGAGLGPAPGSGAGTGGQGNGNGSGTGGNGRGSGMVSPPVHVSGALSNSDYRMAGAPRGAGGTVFVSYRVRSDGGADHCQVLGVNGYPGFADITCRLIEQRFRFRPALDESGRPIDWTIRTDYTWVPR